MLLYNILWTICLITQLYCIYKMFNSLDADEISFFKMLNVSFGFLGAIISEIEEIISNNLIEIDITWLVL